MTLDTSTITAEKHCRCGHRESLHKMDAKGKAVCTIEKCQHCKPGSSFSRSRAEDKEDYGFEFAGYVPQDPLVTVEDAGGIHEQIVSTHPAFGQIVANRVQGGAYLYGSDFRHQHFISIQIHESDLHRHLSGDRHSGDKRIIELSMSEAQWATFVSSLNQGDGVPCTFGYEMHIGPIPRITQPPDRTTQFSGEMAEHFALAKNAIAKLRRQIDTMPLSGVKKAELLDSLRVAESNIGPSMDFVTDRFDEHMEKTVEKAKSEVNAYAGHLLTSLGERALALEAGDIMPIKLLDAPDS